MADKTIIATGASVSFGTSGFTMYLDSIGLSGGGREAIRTSHLLTTGSHTFGPGDLFDEGTVTLAGHFNPDNEPPVSGETETVTITWPVEVAGNSAATWAAPMFVVNRSFDATMEDKATGTIELKVAGAWTVTAEATP
jgi:hypothetical protein